MEECRALGVEDMRFQRRQDKHIMLALCFAVFFLLLLHLRITRVDEVKEPLQAVSEVRALLHALGRLAGDMAGDLPQVFDGVARRVDLVLHWGIAEIRARLDEQHEQHAVHIAQALQREV